MQRGELWKGNFDVGKKFQKENFERRCKKEHFKRERNFEKNEKGI